MTPGAFEGVFAAMIANCKEILIDRCAQYSPGTDRHSNFRKAAALQSCSPEAALWGMVSKHIVALSDYIGMLEAGDPPPYEWWDEKITDIINYLALLNGLLIENLVDDDGPVRSIGSVLGDK